MSETKVANSRTHRPRTAARPALAFALILTAGLASMPSRAQWFVQDNSSIAKSVKEYAEQAKRWVKTAKQYRDTIKHYGEQVAHWQNQINHWKEQLVKLQGLNFKLFALKNQFKKVADDYGVIDECPGVSGGFAAHITTALQSFLPDMGGSVVKQQQELCQLIVMSKNAKYNMTVDYLEFVATASSDLEQVQADRLNKVSRSPGNLQSILTDTERYASNLDTAREKWETNMKQQDAQISMLQQIQANLSRRAMNGQPSPLGTLVNTAAMRAAFRH
jgi:DNA repair exonuclease SbcCD ATPase subunit